MVTKRDILGFGGERAEKFRDHVGETVTITGVENVRTRNGDSVQIVTEELGNIWAPSVVARQAAELAEHRFLPARLILSEAESSEGRRYFTLEDAEEEVTADA